MVHGDIKPENTLLDKEDRVKIADFALTTLLKRAPADLSSMGTRQVMGTPRQGSRHGASASCGRTVAPTFLSACYEAFLPREPRGLETSQLAGQKAGVTANSRMHGSVPDDVAEEATADHGWKGL